MERPFTPKAVFFRGASSLEASPRVRGDPAGERKQPVRQKEPDTSASVAQRAQRIGSPRLAWRRLRQLLNFWIDGQILMNSFFRVKVGNAPPLGTRALSHNAAQAVWKQAGDISIPLPGRRLISKRG